MGAAPSAPPRERTGEDIARALYAWAGELIDAQDRLGVLDDDVMRAVERIRRAAGMWARWAYPARVVVDEPVPAGRRVIIETGPASEYQGAAVAADRRTALLRAAMGCAAGPLLFAHTPWAPLLRRGA